MALKFLSFLTFIKHHAQAPLTCWASVKNSVWGFRRLRKQHKDQDCIGLDQTLDVKICDCTYKRSVICKPCVTHSLWFNPERRYNGEFGCSGKREKAFPKSLSLFLLVIRYECWDDLQLLSPISIYSLLGYGVITSEFKWSDHKNRELDRILSIWI